jgi:hypothetical protein
MASVSIYNHHRFARSSLKRSRKFDASLTIELYGDHWRFKGSVGIHNSRSRLIGLDKQHPFQETVLEYDGPMRVCPLSLLRLFVNYSDRPLPRYLAISDSSESADYSIFYDPSPFGARTEDPIE